MSSLFHINPFAKRQSREPPAGSVNVGDRFYKPGQRGRIWTVTRLFKPSSNSLTHVVLERDGECPETYVISLVSLMNPHMFRPERRDGNSINVKGLKRRWDDRLKTPPAQRESAADNGEAGEEILWGHHDAAEDRS